MKIAVVGGGIAGLAAAWELRSRRRGHHLRAWAPGRQDPHQRLRGSPVDEGPDAFITRVPDAIDLCQELGLTGELVAPAAGRTLLWVDGRLQALPEGLVLGVPRRLGPLARIRLLSPLGSGGPALRPGPPPPPDRPTTSASATDHAAASAARWPTAGRAAGRRHPRRAHRRPQRGGDRPPAAGRRPAVRGASCWLWALRRHRTGQNRRVRPNGSDPCSSPPAAG